MFFNYDLFEIVAITFVVSGIFLYNYTTTATLNSGNSLVNTLSNSESSNNLATTSQLIDVEVQTEVIIPVESATTYVNTGMQTSARIWLESIKNWINEILSGGSPAISSHSGPGYVDVGVQTNDPTLSFWGQVKQWFLEVYSVRDSELSSIGENRINNWINKLDSVQEVSLHDSESSLTQFSLETDSPLQQLVNPDDSVSNISEVISESNLQIVNEVLSEAVIPYNINDVETYNHLLVLPDAKYSTVLIDGVQQSFIILGDAILAINPAVMNLNLFI